ncbi:MAG TPA: LpqB family beta-propeller domain-containing protein [Natronosporangium sp.]|nr:LpqB family beta-propeller domain-containing protein [Natronosporangium sp.]
MSRLAAGTLAVVLAGGLAAACGVPQWTDVVTEGSGPGAEPAGAAVPRVPPGPDEASDPKQLVQYFLQAAAADPGNAVEELRPFIHSSQQRDWQPNPQVWVVRVEGDPVFTDLANGQRVELTVQPIGILSDGVVEPRADSQPREYRFQVVSDAAIVDEQVGAGVDRVRYRVIDAPLAILLDQRALAERGYLRPTSVYVWDDDNNLLVPDLRWLPTAASPAQAAQAKLEWLIDGPAPWLESMSGLPGNLELQGNPVWREDHLDVAFTTSEELGKETLRRIDAQVWWTLRDLLPDRSTVSLTINGESREITGAHASARSIRYRSPDSFVLLGDRLVPYVPGDVAPPDIPLPSDTRSAALTSRGREVTLAVVHPAGEERLRLSLLTVDGIVGTDLTAGAMSRPVWLSHPSGTGLVVADGTLYRFTAGQTAVQEVVVPGLSRRITALSVAPDGRRLALVADGELWVTSLVRRADGVGVNRPQRLLTSLADVSAVAFIQENWIAIIGRDGSRSVLFEVTVDGAYEQELPNGDLGAPRTVANLVGFPGDPHNFNPRGSLMYEFEDYAVRYDYSSGPSKIQVEELATEPPAEGVEPRAPFFAE